MISRFIKKRTFALAGASIAVSALCHQAVRRQSTSAKKLWGGRFTGDTDPLMEKFNDSINFDKRLWKVDIEGSCAYARALCEAKIITKEEADKLTEGLQQVAKEWESGEFKIVAGDEDIHTANERRLGEIIGATAGKLHTGRSRNDQVATDVRLWMKTEISICRGMLVDLLKTAASRAENEIDILMPGYTHLQPAQPIRWSHWMMSHAWRWKRDLDRLDDLSKRVDVMPLGSGALAGHPFGLNRKLLAKDLKFSSVSPNSLDSVSDRDFIAEFLFWASMLGIHLSQWSEDLIIYGSSEYGYVTMSDAYATGSSLMPQKKNPDALELLRGKSGRTLGNLIGLLTTLKGLPSTYNKDLQEDKELLFDCVDTLHGCIPISTGVLSTLTPNPEKMRGGLAGEMLATDLADYLVRKGVPFRETHHVAGEAVALAEKKGCDLTELEFEDLKPLHSNFEADVVNVWSMEASVESRNAEGGTSKDAVLEQVRLLKSMLE
mmetsp:Transcript_24253/g.36378  ORF Transcript_24253/g.36378 Transcript_24253/m.36378 type:complete len:491 (+) Transcript_24253:80-1552(+)